MTTKSSVYGGALTALFLTVMFVASMSMALTPQEIMDRTQIVNLEANPVWFMPNQPIDFIVTIRYDGGTQDGFDVGIFHEDRLVGLEENKRFNRGMNTFKLRDANFKGDRGDYIVKIRFRGNIFVEKRFATRSFCGYTIDPKADPWTLGK